MVWEPFLELEFQSAVFFKMGLNQRKSKMNQKYWIEIKKETSK